MCYQWMRYKAMSGWRMAQAGQSERSAPERPIPLIAIGASAGGLEPLEAFFQAAPEAEGWCFVVVQHLSPDYRSMMDELLGRKSRLRIRHIDDGAGVEPDTIFLNRPNMMVELVDGVFRTSDYQTGDRLPHLPIDRFFQSLAARAADRTVAVVLSGSGADGTRGAVALHAAGAAVLVQSPSEATFSSMPRSVLTAGAVDRVLGAADMPAAIRDILQNGRPGSGGGTEEPDTAQQAILHLLEAQHHVDFSAYKPINVQRRIERRQHLRGMTSLAEYRELLASNQAALDELYQDLLIGVTEFYRDPESIAALRAEVLDKLVRDSDDETPLRIWVPACASGEEAYTIAIELSEAMRQADVRRRFRIIATDVHRRSIDIASAGVYSEAALTKVPLEIRDRYFLHHRGQFIVEPTLRQKIIFSVHDAMSDPPFMHLDLISCRNLLIYLNDQAQDRVISMFLFGLRRDGFLLLGPSECLGRYAQEFRVIDGRWRLFQKVSNNRIIDRSLLAGRRGAGPGAEAPLPEERTAPVRPNTVVGDIAELRNRDTLIKSYDALLKRYAPSSILVTADGAVLSWFGAAGAFVDTMNNLADWTVEDIVHPGLHFTINVGMEKLRQGQLETHVRRVGLDMANGTRRTCTVQVEPLDQFSKTRLMLVCVRPEGDDTAGEGAAAAGAPVDTGAAGEDATLLTRRIQEMERDLRLTEETLQHDTARLEASGEELQAANEELQASNEELQASNEELQSANEELHAVNDELVSLTTEHEHKIAMLSELNRNMDLVLRVLDVGVVVLDADLRIKRFSDLIGRRFLLQAHDTDRPLNVVGPRLDFVDLTELAATALASGERQSVTGAHGGDRITVSVHVFSAGEDGDGDTRAVLVFRGLSAPG